jgi:hypothetical protein
LVFLTFAVPLPEFPALAKKALRPVKTWGPVDGRGHAVFGWRMEEEAKLEFTITVNWRRKDGSIATTQLGTLDRGGCRSAEDVGLQLADAKPILGRLQEIVVSEQLQRYCEAVRPCPRCHRRRHLKDYRERRYDTVFGRLVVGAPRFDGCRHCDTKSIVECRTWWATGITIYLENDGRLEHAEKEKN